MDRANSMIHAMRPNFMKSTPNVFVKGWCTYFFRQVANLFWHQLFQTFYKISAVISSCFCQKINNTSFFLVFFFFRVLYVFLTPPALPWVPEVWFPVRLTYFLSSLTFMRVTRGSAIIYRQSLIFLPTTKILLALYMSPNS